MLVALCSQCPIQGLACHWGLIKASLGGQLASCKLRICTEQGPGQGKGAEGAAGAGGVLGAQVLSKAIALL